MNTIFVPTDLSSHADEALKYALELAKAMHANKLVYYHNNPQPIASEIPVIYVDDLELMNQEIKDKMTKDLHHLASATKIPEKSMEFEVLVTSTLASSSVSIVDNAHKHKAELIVMGTHGKTGFEKLVFGSVTSGVLEQSSVPVLAIPPHYHFRPVGKIAYASSLTYFTHEVNTILDFGKDLILQLEIIHVDFGLLSEKSIAHAKRMLEKLNDPRIKLTLMPAHVDQSLNENLKGYLAKTKPDWLVMFPAKREWYERLFLSSKTLELAMEFRKPMLIIQKKAD